MKKLMLMSNSTNFGGKWLEHAENDIKAFFGNDIKKILFIPYAGVSFSYDDYAKKAFDKFYELGYQIESIHDFSDKKIAIKNSEAIAVGGGNTFHLLDKLYEYDLVDAINEKVENGTPYIGWSAGSNLTCPTIKTTNDMPIVQPPSFNALNLIPFQINPHYTEAILPNHQGETREQRIIEYLYANKDSTVVGLREGSSLIIIDNEIRLLGNKSLKIFQFDKEFYELTDSENLNFLMDI